MPVGPLRENRTTGRISFAEVLRYSFELLIFFLGVYLAFLLTDYQDELKERAIRVKYYDSLILEFQRLVGHLDEEESKLKAHVKVIDEIEKGNRPFIPTSDLYFIHRGLVVNAAIDGRNFESLDSKIIGNIVMGVPALDMLDQRVSLFNQLSANLPAMQVQGESCCYDSEGALLPQLRWYPRLIGEIHQLNRDLRTVVADIAIPDIEAAKERLEQSLK